MPEEDYDGVPFPHPYIEMWIECRRYADVNGTPALPEPHKGALNQDADLMLGFEVLEEAMREREREAEMRQRNKEAARQMSFGLPIGGE